MLCSRVKWPRRPSAAARELETREAIGAQCQSQGAMGSGLDGAAGSLVSTLIARLLGCQDGQAGSTCGGKECSP